MLARKRRVTSAAFVPRGGGTAGLTTPVCLSRSVLAAALSVRALALAVVSVTWSLMGGAIEGDTKVTGFWQWGPGPCRVEPAVGLMGFEVEGVHL